MSALQSILVVEDEGPIREITASQLEDAGFNVVVAEDGNAALAALDDNAEPFCAIVTDINLGFGPDGWAVGRRGRQLNHELPVVYVTGGQGHEWKARGVPHSILLAKPFTRVQIVGAFSLLLNGG